MKILGVDTSCDECCAAVIESDDLRLCSDVVHTHIKEMKRFGGVVPEIASREHLKAMPLVVDEALNRAGLTLQEIDWFAVSNRPGLIGALLVGVSYIKALAMSLQKPFTALNHIEAHVYSPLLGSAEDDKVPPFPWICLVASGGHTELFKVDSETEWSWLGGTLDDAAGEAFDKIGKVLGFPYPAGPYLDRLVRENKEQQENSSYRFPVSKVGALDFSFSGLKTAVALAVQKETDLDETKKIQIAAAAQDAIVDALEKKLLLAAEKYPEASLVVTGGVACNSRLRERITKAYFPRPKHCTDNAAMVAMLAALKCRANALEPSEWTTGAAPSVDFPKSASHLSGT